MTEVPIPQIKPKEEIWNFCERLAEKHEMTPLNVLKRLVQIGKCIADVEEGGGVVTARVNGREVPIEVFKYK